MPIKFNAINPRQAQVDDLDQSMTTTAHDTVAEQNTPDETKATPPKVDPKVKKKNTAFRQRVDSTKTYRRKLITNWTTSIDYRRGKPFTSQTDDDQVAINQDWTLTK